MSTRPRGRLATQTVRERPSLEDDSSGTTAGPVRSGPADALPFARNAYRGCTMADWTRRDWLKTTTAAGGAMLLPNVTGILATGSPAASLSQAGPATAAPTRE